jgi:hypothetical protein
MWARKQITNGRKAADPSVLEFKTTEYGRARRVVASEGKDRHQEKWHQEMCPREWVHVHFIRKLLRGLPVKTQLVQ